MSARREQPVGVVLAGGRGRRMGGGKALATLAGRPLISYPLAALQEALGVVRVVAKPGTPLPPLPPDALWVEPEEPQHPLAGIVFALHKAAGRPVVVCAADMPLLTPALVERLATADARGAPAVVAMTPAGELEPLLARYEPTAAARLEGAAAAGRLREAVRALRPQRLELTGEEAELAFNVNTPEDLARAERLLSRR